MRYPLMGRRYHNRIGGIRFWYRRIMVQAERPLRKDAERNRQRILAAARELFAERGLAATLNDVAHEAGVGVGTVYRRFPNKAELVDALFDQYMERLTEVINEALEDPDAWRGLVLFLERMLELQVADRALGELFVGAAGGFERIARARERL